MMSDPIADFLTRIRNSNRMKHRFVNSPYSKIKKDVADILLNEGFIESYEIIGENISKSVRITLKYTKENKCVINGLKRISKPGLRIYSGFNKIKKVLNGLGIAVISSNKGVITDKLARDLKVGGEILAHIW
ncbi:MAG: 30S ribosomal protein S8 [Clostridiales bacterium]|jgi:small subunit ribosomal protein S8|nr:30S ribosomal protein S8 [Clostridiales bacterium]